MACGLQKCLSINSIPNSQILNENKTLVEIVGTLPTFLAKDLDIFTKEEDVEDVILRLHVKHHISDNDIKAISHLST